MSALRIALLSFDATTRSPTPFLPAHYDVEDQHHPEWYGMNGMVDQGQLLQHFRIPICCKNVNYAHLESR
jgi:hypothetical protein